MSHRLAETTVDPWICTICGLRYSSASMGGPGICPACDCGYSGPDMIAAQRAAIVKLREECHHWERMARVPAEGDPLEAAIEIIRDIAAMGRKAGSETAKNWLQRHGYPLEAGGYVPGKGFEP